MKNIIIFAKSIHEAVEIANEIFGNLKFVRPHVKGIRGYTSFIFQIN
jgi:hypothetical protein